MAAKKKYRFELLAGSHSETQWVEVPPEDRFKARVIEGPPGVFKTLKRASYIKNDGMPGDIIETDRDLEEIFNRKNVRPKFKRLYEGQQPAPQPATDNTKLFEMLTIAQLKSYAEDEEIELGDATTKVAIIEALTLVEVGATA